MPDITLTVDAEILRRVLNISRVQLAKLRTVEGGDFPPIDKATLRWINDIQFKHRELI